MKNRNHYSIEFRNQALIEARERGEDKTLQDVADELNVGQSTLRAGFKPVLDKPKNPKPHL